MIWWLIVFVLQNIVENKLFSNLYIYSFRYLCSFGKMEINLIIIRYLLTKFVEI